MSCEHTCLFPATAGSTESRRECSRRRQPLGTRPLRRRALAAAAAGDPSPKCAADSGAATAAAPKCDHAARRRCRQRATW